MIRAVALADVRLALRPGCPIELGDLRLVEVTHLGFDGALHDGRIIVHRDHAQAIEQVFTALLLAKFPIERIEPIDAHGADDERAMAANNTSGFNGREIARLPGVWSEHAYGRAVDLNPVQNPYVVDGVCHPPAGAPFLDRTRDAPGMIHPDGPAVRAFAAIGWSWGGLWASPIDYHHFSATGR